jgi:hypothetical protein
MLWFVEMKNTDLALSHGALTPVVGMLSVYR